MCVEASTVLRAVAADFFFNCWYMEIPSDNRIRPVPRCVHYQNKRSSWFMFSGKQAYMSTASPQRPEASTVLRAVAADFFFNCWCMEIPSDNRIRHVPRCVHYQNERSSWFMFSGNGVQACISTEASLREHLLLEFYTAKQSTLLRTSEYVTEHNSSPFFSASFFLRN
jgi:hypothetical protein